MRKYNILLGFIGYMLTAGVAPVLFIEGRYLLGILSMIAGLAVIDYNRGGS
jgi:hypothetical protein